MTTGGAGHLSSAINNTSGQWRDIKMFLLYDTITMVGGYTTCCVWFIIGIIIINKKQISQFILIMFIHKYIWDIFHNIPASNPLVPLSKVNIRLKYTLNKS